MPSFVFTSPDGKSYTVNGPEGATAEQAFGILQQQLSAQAPAAPAAAQPAESEGILSGMGRVASDIAKQFAAPVVAAPFQIPRGAEMGLKGLARQSMEGEPEAVMPASVYQPGLDTEEALFGPETAQQRAQRKLQAQRAVSAMPSIPGAETLGKIGDDVQKGIQDSLSKEGKKALRESQITGNIFKGEIDFGKNPTVEGYALQVANVFGSMAAPLATSIITKKPSLGGAVGGAMAADEAGKSAAEFIGKLSNEELSKNSPLYAELIAGGASPKEARELTIKKAAETGAALQGLVATFGDAFTGRLVTGQFDDIITKMAGKTKVGRAAGAGVVGGGEESLQEVMEGLASDVGIKATVKNKELGEDSASNLVMGFLGGAGPAGIRGAIAKEEEAKAPPEAPPPAGLPGLVPPAPPAVAPVAPPVAPAAPATLEEQVADMMKAAETPATAAPAVQPAVEAAAPSEEAPAQDLEAMLKELETAMGEGKPAGEVAHVPAEPIVQPTEEVARGPEAPEAVQAEAQGQEAPAAKSKLTAPAGSYSPQDTFELDGRKWSVEAVAHTGKELTAVAVGGGPFRRERMNIGQAPAAQAVTPLQIYMGLEDAAGEMLKNGPVKEVLSANGLINDKGALTSKGRDLLGQLKPAGLSAKQPTKEEAEALIRANVSQPAQPVSTAGEAAPAAEPTGKTEKTFQGWNQGTNFQNQKTWTKDINGQSVQVLQTGPQSFAASNADAVGSPTNTFRSLQEAQNAATVNATQRPKAAPKPVGPIDVGSRVEWVDQFGEKQFGTVAKINPANEKNKLPAMAWVQSDAMSNAQTSVRLNELHPTTQPKVARETGPTARERREKQQDNRLFVGRRLDDAIKNAQDSGATDTASKLIGLREKFDRKEAGPKAVEDALKKAQRDIADEVRTPKAEMDKLKQEMQDALGDLSMILTKGTRLNIVPEDEQKLIPVLTRVMDIAFRMGYIKFKEAAKYVLDTIRAKLGDDAADQITLDHLQGAYIGMAGKYQDQGASSKKEVVSIESLEELEEGEGEVWSLSNADNKFEAAQAIAEYFLAGKEFGNINAARSFLDQKFGIDTRPGTPTAKQADEAIEAGVVLAAQQIVADGRKNGLSSAEIYDQLVNLYERQPNLAVRTSTSVANQAYSTPVPLAYLVSELAGIDQKTSVYEPTAGNGVLVIAADPKNLTLNELNGDRYEMLKRLYPDATVTQGNALENDIEAGSFDVVVENPPFGKVGDISNIDHDIANDSLRGLKDNGRAVLILGGVQATTEDGRREGYRGKAKREFYYQLYNTYNVVDHFTVGGNLYSKQGTTFPVDVIVIDGVGKSQREMPAADLPQLITSYEQLKEKLNEARMVSGEPGRPGRTDIGVGAEGKTGRKGVGRSPVGEGGEPGAGRGEPAGGVQPGVSEAGPAVGGQPGAAGVRTGEGKPAAQNIPEPGAAEGPVARPGEQAPGRGQRGAEGRGPGPLGGVSIVSGERVESGLTSRVGEEQETAGQVTYTPHSTANAVGTLVPRAMADSIEQSLARVEAAEGNLDDYVARSLDMDPETVRELFSAEQVDALSLAIRNAQEGKGFIIGDQTGVGKGRVVAAMIRYALINDKIPIFVTEKPNLYADMIRDLDDIGMTNELGLDTANPKILITNAGEKIPYTLLRTVNGQITENNLTLKSLKTDMDGVLKKMQQDDSLGGHKVIFTTYSQMQTVKGKVTERMRFLSQFGAGNYMIFDESHNAGGAGEQQARTKEQREKEKNGESTVTGRAAFVRNLVRNAYGTFFSSATYAKRPDVMDLYSSTDMKLAVERISDLADAIKQGGIPMQQTVAQMLTQVGQYIRRERTFAGVAYNTEETKVDKATAENMATSMRDILAFSRMKEVVVKGLQKEFDKQGAKLGLEGEKTKVQSANFGSTMHNLINQMLLSLKAQDSVRHAIERLQAGEKVVMTVANTMGSFLKDYADDMGLSAGDVIDLSFADLYMKYLEKQRMVTIKRPGGKSEQYRLTDQDLGPQMVAEYNRIANFIQNAGFGAAPISPIDYMHAELRKAGYKTDEITGRTMVVNYEGGKPTLASRSSNIAKRLKAVKDFNSGAADVLILNQAGSTGLSLHASSKVKDQRKRHMIIVQPEANIDTHMQMLGRVHRTGQVIPPAYSQMMADIPAEMRPAAILLKKMASLNANTTASRKSAVTAEGAVDFMNDYGGQIVHEYLRDHPEVYEAIGGKSVVQLAEDPAEADEADIRKFTGYVPMLPIKQQEEIYKELVDRYNELIEREDSMGTNKLEAKAVDLGAKTISTKQITEDKGDPSVFAQPAIMEQVDVKRTVKPFSKDEVRVQSEENLKGMSAEEFRDITMRETKARSTEFGRAQVASMEAAAKPDPVKIEKFKNDLNAQYAHVKTVIDSYPIGTPVSIKNTNGVFVYGVVTNIESKGKTRNPVAGSDWKMTLALANGDAKAITINFSQIGTTYTLAKEETVQWLNPDTLEAERIPLIDMFDKGATVRREKRWMVTGNILAGYAAVGNMGQILTYTKEDGTTAQGILMPRTFDFEKQQKNAPVKLGNVQKIMAFLDKYGDAEVSTENGVLRIQRRGGNYKFIVPSSKRDGGSYYLDDGLTNIVGGFTKSGPIMTTTVHYEFDLEKALQYITSEREESFWAVNHKDEAREAFQVPLANVEPSEEMLMQNPDEALLIDRKQLIADYAKMRQRRAQLMRKFGKGEAGIAEQREYTDIEQASQDLRNWIDATAQEKRSALDVYRKAVDEYADGNISEDVFSVIETLYKKFPFVLEGLQLSVTKSDKAGTAGRFYAMQRIVRLFKGTNGVSDPVTARHEIVHSLEQMMSPEAAKLVVEAWTRALEKAVNTDKSEKAQTYFKAILDFINDPTMETYQAALNALPSYDYYQYLNPSEYWAVNAEKLMARKLGNGWDRFVLAVKKLYEGLKSLFGFDNQYAIHKVFDNVMNARQERMTHSVLVDYISHVAIDLANVNTRRNYKGGPAPLATWTSMAESNIDDFIYRVQDKHIDTKRVIQAIMNEVGDIEDRFDVYMREELYHGRVSKQTADFLKFELLPILKDMKKRGLSLAEVEEYMHNRAAPERNALIASRNPQMPDGGSGIFDQEAADYMASLTPEKKKQLQAVADQIDKIVHGTQDLLVNTGLEKQETIDEWRKTQPNYVPMNRDENELDFTSSGTGLGMGFSTKGRFTRTAAGSLKTVVDIFGNIALQRERAIIKSEKARVGRALYGLAIANPNPDFWMPVNPAAMKNKKKLIQELKNLGLDPADAENIIQEPRVPRYNKQTGQIEYEINPNMRNRDNVFSVRINGEDRYVFFNPGDPRAKRMVEALKNLDAHQLHDLLNVTAELTRTYAAMNTQYNPVFGAWNFARDTMGAAINLNGTPLEKRKTEVFTGAWSALRAIYRDLRGKGGTTPEMQKWVDLFERFQKAGGQTGYREQFSRSKDRATIVQRELKNLEAGTARKAAKAVFDWLSDYNDAMENAVRLSAFKAALEEGLSEERAASLAKNLTVNFNRKGQMSTNINALWAFFNASVQGTARMAQLLVDRTPNGRYKLSKHGKRIIAGGMMIGVAQAIALSMAGFGDDEPPEFLKNKNLIIPDLFTGSGNYLIIPMPLGLNVFPNVGRTLTEFAMSNRKGDFKLGRKVLSILLDSFNPLGSSGLAQTIAPTIIDPFVALGENKDAFGRPISKEGRATNPTPGYERNRESASALSKGLSYAINYMTGGGKYGIGEVSPTADQLDYLAGQYMGGVGREISKAARFVGSIGGDEEIPPYKVPILGKLYGETTTPSAVTDKFYKNVTMLAEREGTIKRMREDKISPTEYKREYPETKLISRANRLENEISKLNRTIKDLGEKPETEFTKDRIKRLKEQKTRMMTKFNEAVATAQQ